MNFAKTVRSHLSDAAPSLADWLVRLPLTATRARHPCRQHIRQGPLAALWTLVLRQLTGKSTQDTEDPNPLIRALAIRTMGMLRAEKILDYIADPLRKCLRDENPYVRKTAALGVMKLYDMKPSLAVENGFVSMLQEMVTDSNPMVRARSSARSVS